MPTTVPTPLLDSAPDTAALAELRRLRRFAAWPLVITLLLLAAWTGSAPLAGAVVAPATVAVEQQRKTVAHQEGGIVHALFVRDGQRVRAGQALMTVGDLRHDADLATLQDRERALQARIARAEAEARGAARFEPPAALVADGQAAAHVERERAVFSARRQTLDEQGALLQQQAREAREQAAALEAQISSTTQSVRLSDEELSINDRLADEGFVHRTRLIGLQRVAADYRTRLAEHRSELASARQRATELLARAAALRLQHQAQASDELREAGALQRELEQALRPSRDQVERQTVRAPVDGVVMALRVAGAGAVVAPREALLELVPAHEKLVFRARIAPADIVHVQPGGAAELRLVGGDAARQPALPARISVVAADRTVDKPGGEPAFDVAVELDAAALQRPGLPALRPGMAAELYITTAERSLLQYLLAPLNLFTQRALREP